jgi:flagellar basal body-associated protein FliL
MGLNLIGTISSIVSLVLAVVFWWLASKQAEKADTTLNEIKDKMMSWQNDMNKAAINLIEARPEVIAQKVSLEEAKNNSEFMNRLADIVEKLSEEADEHSTGYKMAIVREFLQHQQSSILASEKIKANVILAQ